MTSKKKILQLRQAILKANTQLDIIKNSGKLDYCDEANTKFNKILLQKAVLKRELDNMNQPIMQKVINWFYNSSNQQKEKLICSYFK